MNEEEKKAIEILKENVNPKTVSVKYGHKIYFAIDIVLNLIEKQQKEIEELKVKEYVINSQLANTYWKEKIKEIHKNTDNKFDFTEEILKLIGE